MESKCEQDLLLIPNHISFSAENRAAKTFFPFSGIAGVFLIKDGALTD